MKVKNKVNYKALNLESRMNQLALTIKTAETSTAKRVWLQVYRNLQQELGNELNFKMTEG